MAVSTAEPVSRDGFAIHEDSEEMHRHEGDSEYMTQGAPMYSEEWNSEEETEEENEDEEEVEESVLEDMKKLESTFKGISDRFRLINRIGEGTVVSRLCSQ